MNDILIHLKGCAKTAPLHTTLPANPRHWLGADPKATPVGLYATRSQVMTNYYNTTRNQQQQQQQQQPQAPLPTHSHSYMPAKEPNPSEFIVCVTAAHLRLCGHPSHTRSKRGCDIYSFMYANSPNTPECPFRHSSKNRHCMYFSSIWRIL